MSVGDALAQARSQAGLTIAQVSERTCIRETIVRGIERGDFSACGGDFYARGHIRSIARVVGLDPDELILGYGVYRLVDHGSPSPGRPVASSSHTPSHQSRPKPSAKPTPQASAASAHSTGHRLVIRLTASADCWVQFSKPGGRQLFQRYVLAGQTKTWRFKRAVIMQIGNPEGILLTVNGKALGHVGQVGPVTLNFGPGHKLPRTTAG